MFLIKANKIPAQWFAHFAAFIIDFISKFQSIMNLCQIDLNWRIEIEWIFWSIVVISSSIREYYTNFQKFESFYTKTPLDFRLKHVRLRKNETFSMKFICWKKSCYPPVNCWNCFLKVFYFDIFVLNSKIYQMESFCFTWNRFFKTKFWLDKYLGINKAKGLAKIN